MIITRHGAVALHILHSGFYRMRNGRARAAISGLEALSRVVEQQRDANHWSETVARKLTRAEMDRLKTHGREIINSGGIPEGKWRVGGNIGRNLYIGPPRPDGIDIGRVDSPELAELIVKAVNAYLDK